MNFISINFIVFFAALLSVYFFIPSRLKWLFLLAASYFFYGFYHLENLLLLIIPTLLVYVIARGLDHSESAAKRKWLLIAGLISGLTVLLVFKYANFIGSSLFALMGLWKEGLTFKPFELIHTIGISFYTFKLVSYLVDVYQQRMAAEKHPGYFALYVAFFPQLFMGPIDRAIGFIPELKKRVTFDVDRIVSGVQLVVWGVFKKMVVADRLAVFVNEVFASPQGQGLNLIFGAYFYAFQIYCDFSGYTDIAIGLARILGFKSMKNFDFPYFSKNITGFWNRWHISLSTWLRDYLFLPITYAVMRRIKSPRLLNVRAEAWGYCIGMFVTMFLGGLWHGAAWTFVVWGMLHGLYLVVSYLTKKSRKRFARKIGLKRLPVLHRALRIFITFNLVSFAWIFFRAESFQKAFTYIKYIQLAPPQKGVGFLLFNLALVTVFIALEIIYKNRSKIPVIVNMPWILRIAAFALFVCVTIIFAVDTSNEFIYFRF
jgi:alginate O-acetyltransferase complex protein AlgI